MEVTKLQTPKWIFAEEYAYLIIAYAKDEITGELLIWYMEPNEDDIYTTTVQEYAIASNGDPVLYNAEKDARMNDKVYAYAVQSCKYIETENDLKYFVDIWSKNHKGSNVELTTSQWAEYNRNTMRDGNKYYSLIKGLKALITDAQKA